MQRMDLKEDLTQLKIKLLTCIEVVVGRGGILRIKHRESKEWEIQKRSKRLGNK